MTTLSWLFVLVVGVLVSFLAGRMAAPRTGRLKAMQEERDAASAELRRYKEEVSAHFEKTATLFNEVTGSYRNLYEHLADGSQRLGVGPDANLLQTQPERRRLDSAGEQPETTSRAAVAGAAATGAAATQADAGSAAPETGQPAADEAGVEATVEEHDTAPQSESAVNPQPELEEQAAGEERKEEQPRKADGEAAEDADATAEAGSDEEDTARQPSDYAASDVAEPDKARRQRSAD